MQDLVSFPKYVFVETTNHCNARCIMCAIDFDHPQRKPTLMSDDLFEKIVLELSEYQDRVEKLMLYLDCEPLVDRRLHHLVRRAKEAGIRTVNIATNASLLTETRSVELIEAGLDEIYITVDSLDKDRFEVIRAGLKFEDVIANCLRFIELRNQHNPNLRIRVQSVMQAENIDEGEAMKAYWGRYLDGRDQIALQKAHNWAGAIDIMKFGDEDDVDLIPCISLWGTFCIHVTGEVGLCTMDVTCKKSLGNVSTHSISEIWNGNNLEQVRDGHLGGRRKTHELCHGCTHWREQKRDLSGSIL
jgi:MoaA/NifB/PqqE/SkfB family radical SAM enzyme